HQIGETRDALKEIGEPEVGADQHQDGAVCNDKLTERLARLHMLALVGVGASLLVAPDDAAIRREDQPGIHRSALRRLATRAAHQMAAQRTCQRAEVARIAISRTATEHGLREQDDVVGRERKALAFDLRADRTQVVRIFAEAQLRLDENELHGVYRRSLGVVAY